MPNRPYENSCHSSWVDDKNTMRVYISRNLYGASNHIIILTKKSFRKKISICQKVPLNHICTALEKCPPRREKEVAEYENGLDGFTFFLSTHWESHLSSLKEKWNHLGDLGFEENWLSVRQSVWETTWKCSQGGVPLMIKIIIWYGPIHCWNAYLAMLLVFLMVTR